MRRAPRYEDWCRTRLKHRLVTGPCVIGSIARHLVDWIGNLVEQRVVVSKVTAHLSERYRAKSGGEVSSKSEGAGVLPIAAAQAVVK